METGSHQTEANQASAKARRIIEEVDLRVSELTPLGIKSHVRGQVDVCRAKLEGTAGVFEDCRAKCS